MRHSLGICLDRLELIWFALSLDWESRAARGIEQGLYTSKRCRDRVLTLVLGTFPCDRILVQHDL